MTSDNYSFDYLNKNHLTADDLNLTELPEKVLQFGTGVLLRGLVDYVIDEANRKGLFNGRVVIVKSTSKGDTSAFERQDCLFTHAVRGVENGSLVEENLLNCSISRVISATDQWNEVLDISRRTEVEIIVSNTTEVGIKLDEQDLDPANPRSFPGRLLSVLKARFESNGPIAKGFVIIPTELIVDNGKVLKEIVLRLAQLQAQSPEFVSWINSANRFCSSLVDRIVPGKPDVSLQAEMHTRFPFDDQLAILSESYLLWAIEGDETVRRTLSFAEADKGVVIAEDISVYRELKLRLLNATHTLSSGIAWLMQIHTVREAMQDHSMAEFISKLMKDEIAVAIPYRLDPGLASPFAEQVLDRFRNPYLQHQWINITLQYTSKMKMRVVPVLMKYFEDHKTLPFRITVGFAAFIFFMRPIVLIDGVWYGSYKGNHYPIQDDHAQYFKEVWVTPDEYLAVKKVLSEKEIWGHDLSQVPDFTERVVELLKAISGEGIHTVLNGNK